VNRHCRNMRSCDEEGHLNEERLTPRGTLCATQEPLTFEFPFESAPVSSQISCRIDVASSIESRVSRGADQHAAIKVSALIPSIPRYVLT
jgi:hypothetical protein